MGLGNVWHRTLVYFGLADQGYDEEYGYDEESFPADEKEMDERRAGRAGAPGVRARRARGGSEDFDDIFADDDRPIGAVAVAERTAHDDDFSPRNGEIRVHLVVPHTFNHAQEVGDAFKDATPVIINLQGSDAELTKRMIDFASGLTYGLDGGMQRVAEKVFLLTPASVTLSAEEKARLLEKGFFNQS